MQLLSPLAKGHKLRPSRIYTIFTIWILCYRTKNELISRYVLHSYLHWLMLSLIDAVSRAKIITSQTGLDLPLETVISTGHGVCQGILRISPEHVGGGMSLPITVEEHHHVVSTVPSEESAPAAAEAPAAAIGEHVARAEAAAHAVESAITSREALSEIVAPISAGLDALTGTVRELVTRIDGLASSLADTAEETGEEVEEVPMAPSAPEPPAAPEHHEPKWTRRR